VASKTSAKRPERVPSRRKNRRRLSASPPGDLFDSTGTARLLASNNTVFKQGEAAEFVFKVLSGCIRTHSNYDTGRRRVHAFYFPGDYFGLETGDAHSVSAETVTPSELLLLNRRKLMAGAADDLQAANLLLRAFGEELQRIRAHNLLLLDDVTKSLFAFLHDLRRRGSNGNQIELPMPRNDIADYLGLTTETVSRTLTRLKKTSAIAMLSHRRLILLDPGAYN
jgi:CRP/FNR family transcriptional regulator, nitrogen fixation regulation protein